MTIQNRELNERLGNIETCAREAPEGTYDRAKQAAEVISDCAESIIEIFQAADFKIIGNDRLRDIEAAIYGLMLHQNPEEYGLQTGEGFGAAMDGPARERVLAQTIRDRDSLARVRSA